MPKKTAKPKYRKGVWFVPVRGSYLPVSWKGWLTYIPFLAYLVYSMYVAHTYTGNNWKAVLWIVPNWIAAAVILTWVAKTTS